MADVFYFNSPREPAPLAKYRPAFRRRVNVKKQTRSVNVNMFNQRACVARHTEPLFCPSDASSLFFPGSLTTATTDSEMRYDMDDDLDDDDDEAGGVPLPPLDEDSTMIDSSDLTASFSAVHTPNDSVTYGATSRQHMHFVTSRRSSNGTSRRDHPRPDTRDMWEEEDGRRLRLALEGHGPDEEPRFSFPSSLNPTSTQPRPGLQSRSDSRQSRASSMPSNSTSRFTSRRASTHDALSLLQPPPVEVDNFTSAHIATPQNQPDMNIQFDEDALAVDDPRRHYDFADFMDLWRLRSIHDRRLPRFEPGLQSSVRIGRPDQPVSKKDVASGAVDVQGIRWKTIGPSREDANKARALLHPSACAITTERRHAQRHERKGKHYQFRSFAPGHKAKFSHYQLRNVLGVSSRNEIFYATGSQIVRTSLACPNLQQTVMDLSKPHMCNAGFRVTCLSAPPRHSLQNQSVLVAGGFFGEYAICNVDALDGTVSEGFVTHAYNGLVTHIHTYADRRSGLPQAVFCSNDSKVRLMDVASLRITQGFTYETAVNCASTSPDGRLRVLVGDSQETLITNAETGQALVTLKEHGDHGFACDWSKNGVHIATAAQDGAVLIWDARNWARPWESFGSSVSCARSVHWTESGQLVVAENDDVVRVYDGAKSRDYQEIDFFGSIAGVALVDGGEEMVVANADKTVGGLMTFERRPQGFGEYGSFGREAMRNGCRDSVRSSRYVSDIVTDIVV